MRYPIGITCRSAWLAALAVAALFAACAQTLRLPPITQAPTTHYQPGQFIWHDLVTDDVPVAKRFYAYVFGWQVRDVLPGNSYAVVLNGGRPIGGIAYLSPKYAKRRTSQWLSLISVADVDRTMEHAQALGGKLLLGPRDVPDRGRLVVLADVQGAPFVAIRTSSGDPLRADPEVGDWLWNELWTTVEPASAARFYEQLVGYSFREETLERFRYGLLSAGDALQGGVLKSPAPEVPPNWLPYVRVADVAAIAQRTGASGGRVLLQPMRDPRGGTVAIIADPTGAAVGIQSIAKVGEANGSRLSRGDARRASTIRLIESETER